MPDYVDAYEEMFNRLAAMGNEISEDMSQYYYFRIVRGSVLRRAFLFYVYQGFLSLTVLKHCSIVGTGTLLCN